MHGIFDERFYRRGLVLQTWNTFWAAWVYVYIFDDHDKEGQFNAERLTFILGAGDEGGGDISAHDFKNWTLDILVGDALDVSVVNCMKGFLLCLSQIWSGLLPME